MGRIGAWVLGGHRRVLRGGWRPSRRDCGEELVGLSGGLSAVLVVGVLVGGEAFEVGKRRHRAVSSAFVRGLGRGGLLGESVARERDPSANTFAFCEGIGLVRTPLSVAPECIAHEVGTARCIDGKTIEHVTGRRAIAPGAGNRRDDPAERIGVVLV